jgi:hypothetical protein
MSCCIFSYGTHTWWSRKIWEQDTFWQITVMSWCAHVLSASIQRSMRRYGFNHGWLVAQWSSKKPTLRFTPFFFNHWASVRTIRPGQHKCRVHLIDRTAGVETGFLRIRFLSKIIAIRFLLLLAATYRNGAWFHQFMQYPDTRKTGSRNWYQVYQVPGTRNTTEHTVQDVLITTSYLPTTMSLLSRQW